MLTQLWWLIVGHFVCDYVLQTEAMANGKRRLRPTCGWDASALSPAASVPWGYWMLAHALTHGAWVGAVTGKIYLGMAEAVCHFLIDTVKCEGMLSHRVDQALHLFCEVGWLFIGLLEV